MDRQDQLNFKSNLQGRILIIILLAQYSSPTYSFRKLFNFLCNSKKLCFESSFV
ncbi:unnamed protein product [Moneuplotes crassus]|uniref:Uncharacterized protein n=1 Tax=Euplotes crassus TaxID=5936 RepID=A0AAD2D6Z2_EUPCR|nr:unnamed protein product [Moneuplotes crassus]